MGIIPTYERLEIPGRGLFHALLPNQIALAVARRCGSDVPALIVREYSAVEYTRAAKLPA